MFDSMFRNQEWWRVMGLKRKAAYDCDQCGAEVPGHGEGMLRGEPNGMALSVIDWRPRKEGFKAESLCNTQCLARWMRAKADELDPSGAPREPRNGGGPYR